MLIKGNPNPGKSKSGFIIFLILFLISGVSGCSKDNKKSCTGTLGHQGKTFTGEAKNEADAGRFACNKYCLEADPEVEARYAIWVRSPKGKAAGSPAKQKAIYEDKGLLDFVTVTCANKCLSDAKAGKHQIKVECR